MGLDFNSPRANRTCLTLCATPPRHLPDTFPGDRETPPGHFPDTRCRRKRRLSARTRRLRSIQIVIRATSRGVNTYIHTYIHTCMHACIHTYIHACIHTYVHTYIRTHTHTHTRTHTHTHKYTLISHDCPTRVVLSVPNMISHALAFAHLSRTIHTACV